MRAVFLYSLVAILTTGAAASTGRISASLELLPAGSMVENPTGALPATWPGTMALAFEPMLGGDGSGDAGFRARAGAYEVLLDARGARFRRRGRERAGEEILHLRLIGARADRPPRHVGPSSGRSHYLHGADPGGWVTGVPRYEAVRWTDVYAGIDWIFRGGGGVPAYDFVVAPGADPSRIRLRFEGAHGIAVDVGGNLVVDLGSSRFVHSAPVVYQGTGPTRRAVDGEFVVGSGGVDVGFRIGAYDVTRELVIDPAIGFSSYLGGLASEDLPRIALGPGGAVFLVGTTSSDDFPVTAAPDAGGPLAATRHGDLDAFVAKFDPSGTRLEFATYLGGIGTDRGAGIAVDAEGSVWITGDTASPDFPATSGALGGAVDGFVARLSGDGADVEFAAFIGGGSAESGAAIAIGAAGEVYFTGTTTSDDFPTVNALQDQLAGPSDAFVVKLAPEAGETVFSTYLGGAEGGEAGFGVAADAAGGAWITGSTESADFPVLDPVQAPGGGGDAFVAKLGAQGALVFATPLGGDAADAGLAIAVDLSGSAYVTGQTESDNFPTLIPIQLRLGGGPDAFVTKFAPDGGSVIYSTFLGGESFDVGAGIAVDGSGNAHVTGLTASPDFPTVDSLQPFFGGGSDVFVTRIDDRGTGITYSTFSGGAGGEAGIGIAVDGAGNAYVAGQTNSPDFPTFNPVQEELKGAQDAFVTKYCLSLVFPDTRELGSAAGSDNFSVTTPSGCAWIAFSEAPWITLTSPNVVSGGGEVEFAVEPNATGAPRAGTLNIAGEQVIVLQDAATACEYAISPASENFYMVGGVGRVNVYTTDDCAWRARSNARWIFLSLDKGTGEGVVSYTVEANRTGRQRSGTITVAGHSFVVFDWLREPRD